MDKLTPVKIPLLNPNEPEALLVDLAFLEGQPVHKGDVIALIETTKSTGEIRAEVDGFLVGVLHFEGASLRAGQTLAYIGNTPEAHDTSLPPWAPKTAEGTTSEGSPEGLRLTEPARQLALEEGFDLNTLPQGPLVTRQMIVDRLAPKPTVPASNVPENENRIVIYGAGGHGQSLAALIKLTGQFQVIGFVDDGKISEKQVLGIDILGSGDQLQYLAEQGICMAVNGVGGIGNLQTRLSVYYRLNDAGFHFPTVIHPTAFLEDSVELADGIQVFPFAYIGTQVQVEFGCIINTGAIVSHGCFLAPYVNLSPGATLAGDVHVGEGSLVGMRATINLGVKIGKHTLVGNGATVKGDVPDGGVVPAGTIWPPRS